jgi:hypothetical protein
MISSELNDWNGTSPTTDAATSILARILKRRSCFDHCKPLLEVQCFCVLRYFGISALATLAVYVVDYRRGSIKFSYFSPWPCRATPY